LATLITVDVAFERVGLTPKSIAPQRHSYLTQWHRQHPDAHSNAARAASLFRRARFRTTLTDVNQPKEPKDATKSTEEQRQLQEQLEHSDDDPDAPGSHQSRRNTPDESTR
jgi:hypothetical protein